MKSDLNKELKSGGYIVVADVLSCMAIPQTQKLLIKNKKKGSIEAYAPSNTSNKPHINTSTTIPN